jgi:hypothetical protein
MCDPSKIRDEAAVEGKTFHAYSIAKKRISLGIFSKRLER